MNRAPFSFRVQPHNFRYTTSFRSREETAAELDEADAITDEAIIISDADRELREAFVTDDRRQLLIIVHLVRTTGYHLWEDGELILEDRHRILESGREVVYPLAGDVEWARETESTLIRGSATGSTRRWKRFERW